MLRSAICVVLGHVDHGKSSILDKIRGTAIVKSEPGLITQAIGASIIPLSTIKTICGPLLERIGTGITIPGLLFIDTPGHEAFTNLRRRGGNIADIAILVVDINEGFKPQTIEAVEILRQFKTPFVVAANKIDLMPGWKKSSGFMAQAISEQGEDVQQTVDTKLYTLVGSLSESGFAAERFDRIEDYTQQIAVIPCSAKTGEGIPELLMVIMGLAQRFMEKNLTISSEGPARGTILEVKQHKGLGTTLDVILYDGRLRKGDTIVVGSLAGPIVTKAKALLEPEPLAEMRDQKASFRQVDEVVAATGVKISAVDVEQAVAGMPIMVAEGDALERVKEEIAQEVSSVIISRENEGIVVKADSLGSLEALVRLLQDRGISIRRASIGVITRKDITEADTNHNDRLKAVVVGFNVGISEDASSAAFDTGVKVFANNVIYRLVEEFGQWSEDERNKRETAAIEGIPRPFKIRLLPGYVFRQSNPAVAGVEVISGVLSSGSKLMKEGRPIADVKGIQEENESVKQAEAGKKVAISMDQVTIGRQVSEGDILLSWLPEGDFRKLKELRHNLSKEEIELLKEIAAAIREHEPMWGA